MRKSKSIQARLAFNASPAKKRGGGKSESIDFGHKLLRHPDFKEATEMIGEQNQLEFDAQDGAGLEQVKHELGELNIRHKSSSATLAEIEKLKSGTRRYIKCSAIISGKDDGAVRWRDWRTKDQILLCLTLSFFALAVCIGSANIYSNLVGSGNPIFIDDPILAVLLSTLLPLGSISIKFITNFMAVDKTRKRYAISVYILTLIALIIWTVLFAMNFTGVSGGIDWGDLDETSNTGTALVWSQLVVEMLAASALFLAAEDIYLRYSPDMYMENLEFIELEKALNQHLVSHEKLCQERAEKHGVFVALSAKRQAFINNKVADYVSLRGRFDASKDAQF